MKHAIAWMNFYDNDLQMILVDADNPITAMIEGARQLMDNDDLANDEWLNAFLQNIPESDDYAARIEEIREEFFNTDQLIAVMLPLTGETFRL
jgi:hypothetical protein